MYARKKRSEDHTLPSEFFGYLSSRKSVNKRHAHERTSTGMRSLGLARSGDIIYIPDKWIVYFD